MSKPAPGRVFVSCPSCKEMAYYVEHDRSAGSAHVPCRPCGHELMIEDSGSFPLIRVIVSTKMPGSLGIRVRKDNLNAVFCVMKENLPVLRDLLIELAPLPSPATIFRENVIKIFKFLFTGKSDKYLGRDI